MYYKKTGSSDYAFGWKTIKLDKGNYCISETTATKVTNAINTTYNP